MDTEFGQGNQNSYINKFYPLACHLLGISIDILPKKARTMSCLSEIFI